MSEISEPLDNEGQQKSSIPAHSHGYELARKALEEARAAAKAAGKAVGQGRAASTFGQKNTKKYRRTWSGPGPDKYDPQIIGSVVGRLSKDRHWNEKLREGILFGNWENIVGAAIADHALPRELISTVLHIDAETTSWATQLRLMQNQILAKIAAGVGDGVVTSLRITGPQGPSWVKGPRRVKGRGPRDTYG